MTQNRPLPSVLFDVKSCIIGRRYRLKILLNLSFVVVTIIAAQCSVSATPTEVLPFQVLEKVSPCS